VQATYISVFRTASRAMGCLAIFTLLQFNIGCGGNKESSGEDTQHETAATEVSPGGFAGSAINAPAVIEGKVVETMDSGGYTYVLVQTSGEKVWAAAPPTEIKVGEKVALPTGMQMKNFYSKTLDRTFETIYFVTVLGVQGASQDSPHKVITRPDGGEDIKSSQGGSGVGDAGGSISGTRTVLEQQAVGDIQRAPGGGQTVAEIYARKTDLAGQTVKVRGVVVKFSPAIMGTNWVHLQDGTGTKGTSDLTVTTNATVKVGDLITIQGVLAVNKDFGAGYRYEVIVQGAELITE
jgi:hypothetical protein